MDADPPASLPPERRPKRPSSLLRQLAFAMELPFILVGAVIIGGALGHWLDARLRTTPLLTLLLGLAGFAAGVREVLRRIPKDNGDGGK